MDHIKSLCNIMLAVIPLGAAARIAYCLIAMNADEDEAAGHRKRIRNVLIFTIAAETMTALLRLAGGYFPGF